MNVCSVVLQIAMVVVCGAEGVSQTLVSVVVSLVNHKLGTIPVWRDRRKVRNVIVATVWNQAGHSVVKSTAWDSTHTWLSLCVGMRPLEPSTVRILLCNRVWNC